MKEEKDICLVNMPFDCFNSPSIGLSILKAEAKRGGLHAVVEYGGIFLADYIGIEEYRELQNGAGTMMLVPEMLFLPFAGYEKYRDFEEIKAYYCSAFSHRREEYAAFIDRCSRLQPKIDVFLDLFAERILTYHPKLVGVSWSFQQCNAALALLKRLKEKQPSLITFMGGSAVTMNAGQALIDTMPQIDYIYTGESDDCFAQASKWMIEGEKEKIYEHFPWILRKGGTPVTHAVSNLNQIAVPDYGDYFDALERTGLRKYVNPLLLIEGSRGCWWGCKNRCRFCGLHASEDAIGYRKKELSRLVDEMDELSKRYGVKDFMFTDCILDMEHVKDFPQYLQGKGYSIFAEVKSNLTREQLEGLYQAGFQTLQPGIESLQDDLLKLMNKGNRAIKHMELLKNARTSGIVLAWSIIQKFPTEKSEWYQEMMDWMPLLAHLGPPNLNVLQYQRNSVFTAEHETYGVSVKPCEFYSYITFDNQAFIREFAEYFEVENPEEMPYEPDLQKQVFLWQKEFAEHHMLSYFMQGDFCGILDTRECAVSRKMVLDGLEKEICVLADQVITVEYLYDILKNRFEKEEIVQALEKLKKKKLLIQIGNEILFLAIPRNYRGLKKNLAFWTGYIANDKGDSKS